MLRGFHGDVHTEIKNTVNHSCSKDLGNFGKNLALYLPTQLSQEPAELKENSCRMNCFQRDNHDKCICSFLSVSGSMQLQEEMSICLEVLV